jgi:hypothetical protein
MQCISGIQISGSGTTIINGNKNVGISVSNASAQVIVKGCNSVVTPSAIAGNLAIVDCIVTALGGNAITITNSATTLTLLNSQVLVQAGNNVAPISVAGIYSIINTIYDKPNSSITGTNTNSIDYFQFINADKFITQGGTSSQYVMGDGSLSNGFTGGSGNCITSFYTNNIHACSNEITVHNRVQSTGSDAQNTLSFAFGDNTQALSDYTHAEGSGTIASGSTSHAEGLNTKTFGVYSHSEGSNTRTGTNTAYLATGLTSGVLYLSNTYGNVSANFTADDFIWIHNIPFGGSLADEFKKVSGSTFSAGRTLVYLYDTSISASTSSYIGDTSTPDLWGGNQTAGGRSASVKGFASGAIGTNSFAGGQSNYSFGLYSFATNKSNKVFGSASSAFGTANRVYGTSSSSFGDSNKIESNIGFSVGAGNEIYGNRSFLGGADSTSNGDMSFGFGQQLTINGEIGAILGGAQNTIQSGLTDSCVILGGEQNVISGATPTNPCYTSSILGGSGNVVKNYNSSIVGSENSTLVGDHSVILGGISISGTQNGTVYVPNFVVKSNFTPPTGTTDPTGEVGQITYDSSFLYYRDTSGWKRLSGATW